MTTEEFLGSLFSIVLVVGWRLLDRFLPKSATAREVADVKKARKATSRDDSKPVEE